MKTRFWTASLAGLLSFSLHTHVSGAAELQDCSDGAEPPAKTVEALDKVLSDTIDPASETGKQGMLAPGAVLFVRTPDWSYFKSAGMADPDRSLQLDCRSPYEIGSATKMMTGTVIMQLQEEDRLSLDDKLSDHLPEIAARLPYGDRITLRQLATHTSGVFSYTDNAPDGTPGIMEGAVTDPDMLKRGRSPLELIEFAIEHGEPGFEPGTDGKWAYSNTGYILLGMIIEKLTEQSLAEVFRDRIFDPAGMSDTFFWNDVPRAEFGLPRAWLSAPYDLETTEWNLSQGWAAGGVISTTSDMARFIETLGGGGLFEDDDTLAAMLYGVPADFPMLTYGIGIARKPGDTIGHGGQTLGFESDLGYGPESETTIIIWTNSAKSVAVLGVPLVVQALAGSRQE